MKELNFDRSRDYLICVDSDGCLLDNMELKHKECFCPATVNVWNLQAVSKYARQAAEHVNLYSRTRGYNRFPAIIRTLDLVYGRKEVREAGLREPDLGSLKAWMETTPSLSTTALDEYCRATGTRDPILLTARDWAKEVDANIAHIVRNIRPFPAVKEALRALGRFANIVVVSATPNEALVRELTACGIMELVDCVAGQETGTKTDSIRMAMRDRYAPDRVLKIGDAVSDLHAAQANGVLFYPIVPGSENESWKNVTGRIAEAFREGRYAGGMMDGCVEAFLSALPEKPPWED